MTAIGRRITIPRRLRASALRLTRKRQWLLRLMCCANWKQCTHLASGHFAQTRSLRGCGQISADKTRTAKFFRLGLVLLGVCCAAALQ
ncbi:hypothetical protein p1B273 (plasmid) [Aromatoleum aromaticum EbN1]|uniref:Uncharacterized protein n=1 Tax=Aromatoleum aromaticum (strain DSM 19018 / LMG 30748 / EbN1) TaxID=76114 RepID=Q5NWV7_AROAE|nr:hypothetical protein p1B273 [Aromatoleum aromaticum EbN1]